MRARVYVCVHMCVHVYVCVYMCACVCICVCMYICVCDLPCNHGDHVHYLHVVILSSCSCPALLAPSSSPLPLSSETPPLLW